MHDLLKNNFVTVVTLFLSAACSDYGRLVADELHEYDTKPGTSQVHGSGGSAPFVGSGGSMAQSTPIAEGGDLGAGGTPAQSSSPYAVAGANAGGGACRIETLEWKTSLVEQGNPSAVYCKKVLKHEYRPFQTVAGQDAMCVFPDKTECEEWQFYRGECGAEWTQCAQDGYQVLPVLGQYGPVAFACCFPTGKVCFDQDYALGACTP